MGRPGGSQPGVGETAGGMIDDWTDNPDKNIGRAIAQARGGWVAFVTNIVAHGVWNTTLIAVWLIRNPG